MHIQPGLIVDNLSSFKEIQAILCRQELPQQSRQEGRLSNDHETEADTKIAFIMAGKWLSICTEQRVACHSHIPTSS